MSFKAEYLQKLGYENNTPIMPTNKHFYQSLQKNEKQKMKVKTLNRSTKK